MHPERLIGGSRVYKGRIQSFSAPSCRLKSNCNVEVELFSSLFLSVQGSDDLIKSSGYSFKYSKVKKMLKKGVDVNGKSSTGETALMRARTMLESLFLTFIHSILFQYYTQQCSEIFSSAQKCSLTLSILINAEQ